MAMAGASADHLVWGLSSAPSIQKLVLPIPNFATPKTYCWLLCVIGVMILSAHGWAPTPGMDQCSVIKSPSSGLKVLSKEQNSVQDKDVAVHASDQLAPLHEPAEDIICEQCTLPAESALQLPRHGMEVPQPASAPGRELVEAPVVQQSSDQLLHQPGVLTTQHAAGGAPPKAACLKWIEASKEGDIRDMHKLLQQHAELLNYQAGGLCCSALHWVAARGHVQAMQQLLLWGADPCLQTCTGCTPLFSAAGANHYECVEFLLSVPAVQQQLGLQNEDGLTAAAYALKHGHPMIHGLLQAAEASLAGSFNSAVMEAAAAPPAEAEAAAGQASCGMEAFPHHHQQESRSGLRAGFLLSSTAQHRTATEATASTSINNGSNSNPQHEAAIDGMRVCLFGSDSVGTSSCHNGQGIAATGHHHQEPQQQSDTVQPTDAADVAASEHTRVSNVVTAVAGDRPATTARAAVPIPAVDKQLGRSWLDAARSGNLQEMQAMLATHPQLLCYSGAGTSYAFSSNSALHWAAAKGHVTLLDWLLQEHKSQNSNVNMLLNQADATALHTAAEHAQAACARLLVLSGGADVQQADGLGQSAVQAAAGGTAGQLLARQLLLWEAVHMLSVLDRQKWAVGAMQQLLRLAGKATEAAACVERYELQELAQAVVRAELSSCNSR